MQRGVGLLPRRRDFSNGLPGTAQGAINIPGTRPAGIYTAGSLQYLLNIRGFADGRVI